MIFTIDHRAKLLGLNKEILGEFSCENVQTVLSQVRGEDNFSEAANHWKNGIGPDGKQRTMKNLAIVIKMAKDRGVQNKFVHNVVYKVRIRRRC